VPKNESWAYFECMSEDETGDERVQEVQKRT